MPPELRGKLLRELSGALVEVLAEGNGRTSLQVRQLNLLKETMGNHLCAGRKVTGIGLGEDQGYYCNRQIETLAPLITILIN